MAEKEKTLDYNEALEYLDECFVACAEAVVIRFTDNKNIQVAADNGKETREYFFEDLHDEFSELYPTDQKLKSLNYTEKSRDLLR